MQSNFSFLDEKFPALADLGRKAEAYLYADNNSCLMKLGMAAETIVNLIFAFDRLTPPVDNSAAARINVLRHQGLIDQSLCDILHDLRKARNRAIHENWSSVSKSKLLLQMGYSLCQWFMKAYGDAAYKPRPFVMPPKTPKPEAPKPAPDKAKEEAQEKAMAQAAQEAAAAAPAVPMEERRARAGSAASQRPLSEGEVRERIDAQLRRAGWEADTENLRHAKGTRPAKGRNLAIAEWPVTLPSGETGRADYALFAGPRLLALIEAKAAHEDIPAVLDAQCREYARGVREAQTAWGEYGVPFVFAANGRPYAEQLRTKSGIWSLDLRDSANAPRPLRGWPSPQGLTERLERDIQAADRALEGTPFDLLTDPEGLSLRPYQVRAIQAAERAVVEGRRSILLAMATGTGKTRTVLGMIYRFLRAGRFRRVLFLVDRTALGEQAMDAFQEVRLEDRQPLTDIYSVRGLGEGLAPAGEARVLVQIATVQSMARRVLYGEGPSSITDFDLIVVDEAHRGYILDREMGETEQLYRDQRDYQSKYREVIDYFDAVRIALTATPALHTTEIFGAPVFRYSYREAVIDGCLVDHDAPHAIMTKLRQEGIHYKPGDVVSVLDPVTGEVKNGELLTDEMDFDIESFNRNVITEEFNRAVLEEIARDLDPMDPVHGKTLIYAVNDQHADLIVAILKDICARRGVPGEAVQKLTGAIGDRDRVQEAIRRFKNEQFPNVAVTVDLLTTGIDVPEITRLVFLRRVRSRVLFEQMLGRATRLCPKIRKTHFEVYDPVGVYEILEPVNTMKPVAANPSVTFADLLDGLEVMEDEAHIRAQTDQIAAKLRRCAQRMSPEELEHFKSLAGGLAPEQFVERVLQAEPAGAKGRLLEHRKALTYIQNLRRGPAPVVISDKPDEVTRHTQGYGENRVRPEDYLDAFTRYIQEHRNELAALRAICTRPRDLTREALRDLRLRLDREGFSEAQLDSALSQVSNRDIAAGIVGAIRRCAIGSALVSHEDRVRGAVARLRTAHDFSPEELAWLSRIEECLLREPVLSVDVFDEDPRFKGAGGFARIDKLFGHRLAELVGELNDYLYDDGATA